MTCAAAGMSNAVRGALLALTDTAGSATVADVLADGLVDVASGMASGVAMSALVALAVAELGTSWEAACAKAGDDVAKQANRTAA
ncbi:hypothetical protein [Pandoraea eparura]|jgi:hypothetical protein|uniref:hypothetical protein n=1 Tax=Pandoraea eparura TaxID=2508291 RepID=UPI001FEB0574|nr:hypothetical protein [Pandoraea eparura]